MSLKFLKNIFRFFQKKNFRYFLCISGCKNFDLYAVIWSVESHLPSTRISIAKHFRYSGFTFMDHNVMNQKCFARFDDILNNYSLVSSSRSTFSLHVQIYRGHWLSRSRDHKADSELRSAKPSRITRGLGWAFYCSERWHCPPDRNQKLCMHPDMLPVCKRALAFLIRITREGGQVRH